MKFNERPICLEWNTWAYDSQYSSRWFKKKFPSKLHFKTWEIAANFLWKICFLKNFSSYKFSLKRWNFPLTFFTPSVCVNRAHKIERKIEPEIQLTFTNQLSISVENSSAANINISCKYFISTWFDFLSVLSYDFFFCEREFWGSLSIFLPVKLNCVLFTYGELFKNHFSVDIYFYFEWKRLISTVKY